MTFAIVVLCVVKNEKQNSNDYLEHWIICFVL